MPTLLVIDDNQSVRDILQMVLSRRGYTVFVAESGGAAIALCAEHAIDGAIVDVHMPGMDGLQVCRSLRNQASVAGRGLAVWLMTGAHTRELAQLAAEAGALALFKKPFDLTDLYKRLEFQFSGESEMRRV